MEVIVHKPTDEESKSKIENIAAYIHADAVRTFLNRLQCAKNRKIEELEKIKKEL